MAVSTLLSAWITFRLLIPLALLCGYVFRYNAFSGIYIVLFCFAPLIPAPDPVSAKGKTGVYALIVVLLSGSFCLAQAVFSIYLLATSGNNKPMGHQFPACSPSEQLLRQIGLQSFGSLQALHILRLLLPDVIVFIASLIGSVLCCMLSGTVIGGSTTTVDSSTGGTENSNNSEEHPIVFRRKHDSTADHHHHASWGRVISSIFTYLSIAAASVCYPTLLTVPYFLIFLLVGTLWALRIDTKTIFRRLFQPLLIVYSAVHLLTLYLYQFQFFQSALVPDQQPARLIGFVSVFTVPCNETTPHDPRGIYIRDDATWPMLVYPFTLMVLYWTLASQATWWQKGNDMAILAYVMSQIWSNMTIWFQALFYFDSRSSQFFSDARLSSQMDAITSNPNTAIVGAPSSATAASAPSDMSRIANRTKYFNTSRSVVGYYSSPRSSEVNGMRPQFPVSSSAIVSQPPLGVASTTPSEYRTIMNLRGDSNRPLSAATSKSNKQQQQQRNRLYVAPDNFDPAAQKATTVRSRNSDSQSTTTDAEAVDADEANMMHNSSIIPNKRPVSSTPRQILQYASTKRAASTPVDGASTADSNTDYKMLSNTSGSSNDGVPADGTVSDAAANVENERVRLVRRSNRQPDYQAIRQPGAHRQHTPPVLQHSASTGLINPPGMNNSQRQSLPTAVAGSADARRAAAVAAGQCFVEEDEYNAGISNNGDDDDDENAVDVDDVNVEADDETEIIPETGEKRIVKRGSNAAGGGGAAASSSASIAAVLRERRRRAAAEAARLNNVPTDTSAPAVDSDADPHHRVARQSDSATKTTTSGLIHQFESRAYQLWSVGQTIIDFLMKQSYVISLIVMIAWSCMFHSYITYVFLLWAMALWLVGSSRQACLSNSPFFVVYATILLIIQYTMALNVDWPTQAGNLDLQQLGLIYNKDGPDYNTVPLAIKSFFLFCFWSTMRLFVLEMSINEQHHHHYNNRSYTSSRNGQNISIGSSAGRRSASPAARSMGYNGGIAAGRNGGHAAAADSYVRYIPNQGTTTIVTRSGGNGGSFNFDDDDADIHNNVRIQQQPHESQQPEMPLGEMVRLEAEVGQPDAAEVADMGDSEPQRVAGAHNTSAAVGTNRSILRPLNFDMHGGVGNANDTFLSDSGFASSFRQLMAYGQMLVDRVWVYVCGFWLLLLGFHGDVVIYRIGYAILFIYFCTSMQLSYWFWRRTLVLFFTGVITYSAIVLNLIYVYQFKDVQWLLTHYLAIDERNLSAFGLRTHSGFDLVVELMVPASFLVINMLYLNFVHDDFMKLTAKTPPDDESIANFGLGGRFDAAGNIISINWGTAALYSDPETFLRQIVWRPLVDAITYGYDVLMRALEVHAPKVILLTTLLVCVSGKQNHVDAVDALLIVLIVVALAFARMQPATLLLLNICASLNILSKMIYQLDYVEPEYFLRNCSLVPGGGTGSGWSPVESSSQESDSYWLGFEKRAPSVLSYVGGYTAIIVLCSLRVSVVARQRRVREWYSLPPPKPGKIFEGGTRESADGGIIELIKFLVNFGFYKFGVEITFIAAIINIAARLDFIAVIYALLVLLLFKLRRNTLRRVWSLYCFVLGVLFPVQFLLSLGPPPSACIRYDWDTPARANSTNTVAALTTWMFLPNTQSGSPPSYVLVGDFFQLLFAFCQLHVFSVEHARQVASTRTPAAAAASTTSCAGGIGGSTGGLFANDSDDAETIIADGGLNDEIIYSKNYNLALNPVKDFVTRTRNVLDAIKGLTFCYGYWFCLAMVYLAATSKVSLFSVIYLISCFLFLWMGNELFVRPIPQVVRWWNWFLGYNVLVIVSKTILQLPACVYYDKMIEKNLCFLVQLFGLTCLHPAGRFVTTTKSPQDSGFECLRDEANAGLAWDVTVFVALLLQRRAFKSWYFQYVQLDQIVQNEMASRGAQIMREQEYYRFRRYRSDEESRVRKIKKKMEIIRMKQELRLRNRGEKYEPPCDHYDATRGADYWMFQDDDELIDPETEAEMLRLGAESAGAGSAGNGGGGVGAGGQPYTGSDAGLAMQNNLAANADGNNLNTSNTSARTRSDSASVRPKTDKPSDLVLEGAPNADELNLVSVPIMLDRQQTGGGASSAAGGSLSRQASDVTINRGGTLGNTSMVAAAAAAFAGAGRRGSKTKSANLGVAVGLAKPEKEKPTMPGPMELLSKAVQGDFVEAVRDLHSPDAVDHRMHHQVFNQPSSGGGGSVPHTLRSQRERHTSTTGQLQTPQNTGGAFGPSAASVSNERRGTTASTGDGAGGLADHAFAASEASLPSTITGAVPDSSDEKRLSAPTIIGADGQYIHPADGETGGGEQAPLPPPTPSNARRTSMRTILYESSLLPATSTLALQRRYGDDTITPTARGGGGAGSALHYQPPMLHTSSALSDLVRHGTDVPAGGLSQQPYYADDQLDTSGDAAGGLTGSTAAELQQQQYAAAAHETSGVDQVSVSTRVWQYFVSILMFIYYFFKSICERLIIWLQNISRDYRLVSLKLREEKRSVKKEKKKIARCALRRDEAAEDKTDNDAVDILGLPYPPPRSELGSLPRRTAIATSVAAAADAPGLVVEIRGRHDGAVTAPAGTAANAAINPLLNELRSTTAAHRHQKSSSVSGKPKLSTIIDTGSSTGSVFHPTISSKRQSFADVDSEPPSVAAMPPLPPPPDMPDAAPTTVMHVIPDVSRAMDAMPSGAKSDDDIEHSESLLIRFFVATYYTLLSKTELVCYFMIILYQVSSASVISMPLPLLAFVWGTLAVPRPTRTFWVVVITYIEAMVILKFVLQFRFFDWGGPNTSDPFEPRTVLGLQRSESFAYVDLFLLLFIFLHRNVQKALGLWRSARSGMRETNNKNARGENAMSQLTGILREPFDIIMDDDTENDEADTSNEQTAAITDSQQQHREGADRVIDESRVTRQILPSQDHSGSSGGLRQRHKNQHTDMSVVVDKRQQPSSNSTRNNVQAAAAAAPPAILPPPPLHRAMTAPGMLVESTQTVVGDSRTGGPSSRSQNLSSTRSRRGTQRRSPLYRIRRFYMKIMNPRNRMPASVYSWMFLCDFIGFFVVVLFYWGFGPESGTQSVAQYIKENNIPVPFLLMLILQFTFIVTDRALFLRKDLHGKFIYQIILVLLVHAWMFFILPLMTKRKFVDSGPAIFWYLVKCVYLLLSAYQIRSGYPTRVLENFLTKRYGYVNLFLFKAFLTVPFLLELRCLMDWIWTDTSMTMSNWLKMEDMYVNIFTLKCWRVVENESPMPRGQQYPKFWKYLQGFSLLILIIFIIWFPLLLFSLANTVGEHHDLQAASIEVSLGGYQPIFTVNARLQDIDPFDSQKRDRLVDFFSNPTYANGMDGERPKMNAAVNAIQQYAPEDIYTVKVDKSSQSIWTISPPGVRALLHDLRNASLNANKQMSLYFRWSFYYKAIEQQTDNTVSGQHEEPLPKETLLQLISLIQDPESTAQVTMPNVFPYFIQAPPTGVSERMRALVPDSRYSNFNLTLSLQAGDEDDTTGPSNNNNSTGNQTASVDKDAPTTNLTRYWSVAASRIDLQALAKTREQDGLQLVVFVSKVFPSGVSKLAGYGIIGLYVSLVFVIGRFVRGFVGGISYRIMYEELPDVDKLLKLCLDIYLVRENREFELEEDLYGRLIFLFRSPETLFAYTKYNRRY